MCKHDRKTYIIFVYSIVREDGASIYSVSEDANKEMPNLDVNLRSAGLYAIINLVARLITSSFVDINWKN